MNDVKLITPVANEILDIDSYVKPYLKIDHNDEDVLLQVIVQSAREFIERWCGISIGVQVREWTVDMGSGNATYNPYPTAAQAKRNQDWTAEDDEREIPYGPVVSVDAVTLRNGTAYSSAGVNNDYTVTDASFSTFSGSGRFKVRYTAGYDPDTMPGALTLIWLQLTAYMYTNRGEEGIDIPQQIKYALNPYKRSLI